MIYEIDRNAGLRKMILEGRDCTVSLSPTPQSAKIDFN